MRRGLATFLVFLALMVATIGFVLLLGSMLAGQIVDMVEQFPKYLDAVINWGNHTFHTELSRVEVQDSLLHSAWLKKYVQNSATGVLDVSATVLGGLFRLLTIFLFAFYFAADGPGCAARSAPCCRRSDRPRCCGPGRSRSTRPVATSTRAA